jgi:hypothetical protein
MTDLFTWTHFFITWGMIGLIIGLLVIHSPYFRERWRVIYSRQHSWAAWATMCVILVIVTWPLLLVLLRRR